MVEDMGNPFTNESKDLQVLDTRDIVDSSVVDAMYTLKKKRTRTARHITERLILQTTPLNDPIY